MKAGFAVSTKEEFLDQQTTNKRASKSDPNPVSNLLPMRHFLPLLGSWTSTHSHITSLFCLSFVTDTPKLAPDALFELRVESMQIEQPDDNKPVTKPGLLSSGTIVIGNGTLAFLPFQRTKLLDQLVRYSAE